MFLKIVLILSFCNKQYLNIKRFSKFVDNNFNKKVAHDNVSISIEMLI